MAEKLCTVCNERPAATAGGICMQCFLDRTNSESKNADAETELVFGNDDSAHVSEATIASPTLGKLESTAKGWLASGVIAFVIGLVVFIVGSANVDLGAIQWGIILMGLGALFVQFGFLFFILGRHARVQAEVALYVRDHPKK